MRPLISIIQQHAIKTGEFILASGRTSNYLIDLKPVSLHPHGAFLITEAIFATIMPYWEDIKAFGGMATGAIPIVAALVIESRSFPHSTPGFYVRTASKGHGSDLKIDGCLRAGMRVLLIEDVTTTGGSLLQAVQAVREFGAYVTEAITVVDREEGAAENLRAHGITLTPLLTRSELGIDLK